MRRVAVLGLMILVFITPDSLVGRSLPDIAQASIDELGVTYGIPQMSGFVFIDGEYLPPPYTVTRRGNAIFINRVQIEQPVAWHYFDPSGAALSPAENRKTEEEGDFLEMNDQKMSPAAAVPEKVASIDDLFSDEAGDNAAQEPSKTTGAKPISSIDDLFGDDADTQPAVKQSSRKISSIDDLFGEESDEVVVAAEEKPAAESDPVTRKTVVPQSREELERKKEILKNRLDEKRYSYECAIAKGELYFFGTSHNLINGNYGTARMLMEVLPGALRYSRSPEELLARLKAGNVYFLDLNVCRFLYRNKTTFPLLQQRLDRIKQMEELRDSRKE